MEGFVGCKKEVVYLNPKEFTCGLLEVRKVLCSFMAYKSFTSELCRLDLKKK